MLKSVDYEVKEKRICSSRHSIQVQVWLVYFYRSEKVEDEPVTSSDGLEFQAVYTLLSAVNEMLRVRTIKARNIDLISVDYTY